MTERRRRPRAAVVLCVGTALLATAALGSGCAVGGGSSAAPPPPRTTGPVTGPPTVSPSSSPTTSRSSGPTSPTTCGAAAAIAAWPLERRAAELVVVPVRDYDVAGATAVVRAGVGGVLFLGSGGPPADLSAQLRRLRAAAGAAGPPLVLVDQEGGGVQRLGAAVTSLPWPRTMARQWTPAQVRQQAARLGRQMRALGVTVDLAPVLDVDDRPGPSASNADGSRSFSGDPRTAATYGVAFDEGLRSAGVVGVVKHFPGLGGAVGNSDQAPVATRPLSELRTTGLVPFRAAIAAGTRAVMVSNASVPGLTSRPASLSHAVVTGLLRGELGFQGLVVTDSLSAVSVRDATSGLADAVVQAIAAGSDLVLFGATDTAADRAALRPAAVRATYERLVAAIVAAVRRGTVSTARLDAAVAHVLATKGLDPCASG